MSKTKTSFLVLIIVCIIVTGIGFYFLGGIDQEQLQLTLEKMGIFAPIIYIILYTIGTLLILPSTPLNLTGGAIFGLWMGTVWTSIAAVIAAVIAFLFARNFGKELVTQKFAGKWEAINSEINQGGLFYMFAIRLLPIIPYGLVNFVAGLTSIKFRDYLLGTALGTVPGVFPFVMLGNSGVKAIKTGDIIPIILSLMLIGILVGGSNFYRRSRQNPRHKLIQTEQDCQTNQDDDAQE
jgi:uncharacterized membrane protein YdjX (TVP38/TMEM64 family)